MPFRIWLSLRSLDTLWERVSQVLSYVRYLTEGPVNVIFRNRNYSERGFRCVVLSGNVAFVVTFASNPIWGKVSQLSSTSSNGTYLLCQLHDSRLYVIGFNPDFIRTRADLQ